MDYNMGYLLDMVNQRWLLYNYGNLEYGTLEDMFDALENQDRLKVIELGMETYFDENVKQELMDEPAILLHPDISDMIISIMMGQVYFNEPFDIKQIGKKGKTSNLKTRFLLDKVDGEYIVTYLGNKYYFKPLGFRNYGAVSNALISKEYDEAFDVFYESCFIREKSHSEIEMNSVLGVLIKRMMIKSMLNPVNDKIKKK